jgi:hypothetical protein
MIIITIITGLFMFDNAPYFADVKSKQQQGYNFSYVGKQDVREDVPSLPLVDKIYFSMETSK